jgi:ATP-binding cassette subfamily B protein
MTEIPAIALTDPAIVPALARFFGQPAANAVREDRISLEVLRDLARRTNEAMEVRNVSPCQTAPPPSPATRAILIADGRVVLIYRRGPRWQVIDGNGRVHWLRPRDVFAALRTDAQDRIRASIADDLRSLGFDRRTAERRMASLGPERVGELLAWFCHRPNAPERPEKFLRLWFDEPALCSVFETPQQERDTWQELLFHAQVRLDRFTGFGSMALELLRLEWRRIALLSLLVVSGIPLTYALPSLVAVAVDMARSGLRGETPLLIAIGLILLATSSVTALRSLASARLSAVFRQRLLTGYVFRLHFARLDRLRALTEGDIATRSTDLLALQYLMFNQVLPAVLGLATLMGALIYLLRIAPWTTMILAGAGLVAAWQFGVYTPRLKQMEGRRLVLSSEYRQRLLERMEAWVPIRLLDPFGRLLRLVDKPMTEMTDVEQRAVRAGAGLSLRLAILSGGFVAAVVLVLATEVSSGRASVGQGIAVIGAALTIFAGFLRLAYLAPAFAVAEPSLRRVWEVVTCGELEPVATLQVTPVFGPTTLRLHDICAGWGQVDVLHDFSLQLGPGEWVSLVGPSGCGKSTLAALLGGLLECRSGRVVLDGHELGLGAQSELRGRVVVVPQEVFLLDSTLRENLLLGLDTVRDPELREVVGLCGLASLVRRLPLGLEQNLGVLGSTLSAGERTRVALARALLRRPGLLVLDETLSRLDDATARAVVEALRDQGMTVLLMTHDLARVRGSSRVHVMAEGRIAESGTFDELRARDGDFSRNFEVKRRAYSTQRVLR